MKYFAKGRLHPLARLFLRVLPGGGGLRPIGRSAAGVVCPSIPARTGPAAAPAQVATAGLASFLLSGL